MEQATSMIHSIANNGVNNCIDQIFKPAYYCALDKKCLAPPNTRGGYANANAESKTRVLRLRAFSVRRFQKLRSAFLGFYLNLAGFSQNLAFLHQKIVKLSLKTRVCVRPFSSQNARLRSIFSSLVCVPTSA